MAPHPEEIIILFFFSLTLLLGVLGNAMILWAVLGFREMKSPTNIFLASLAVADLLLCVICLPVKVIHCFCDQDLSFNSIFFMSTVPKSYTHIQI